jgi:ABC-2 type transport system permease protein
MLRDNARILRYSFLSALADLRAMYTWRTWLFAWLVRILAQVTMFALLGRLLGDPARTEYLVIGNAAYVAAASVMMVVASTAWERMAGTLPLLVASPSTPFVVFAGRSVQWLIDGCACSLISLFLLGPVFGLRPAMPTALLAIPVIALTAVSIYWFGLVLAAIALRVMHIRNMIGNLGGLTLMILAGVQVPVSFWPTPLQWVAQCLPLTHGLRALRIAWVDGPIADIGRYCALELGVMAVWATIAALLFRHLAESGRRDGSIEFGG